ncbi:MAG: heme-binding protein [Betaproteobacteria bacterium]
MGSNWKSILVVTVGATLAAAAMQVTAQALPYGATISTENAKKAGAAAFAEARKNNWTQAIAITDPAGVLVYYERMDGTQNAAPDVAQGKARSAALFRRNTKAFQDDVAAGGVGLRYLSLPGVVAAAGGNLLVIDGKIVGAIGVSGGTYAQDEQVAAAGAAALLQ